MIHKENYLIYIIIIGIICVTLCSLLLNYEKSSLQHFRRLTVQLLFLGSSCYIINKKNEVLFQNVNLIKYFLQLLVVFSFVQVFYNVLLVNAWSLPFVGIKTSLAAKIITSVPVYFGDPGKNIWATKIIFYQIILFGMSHYKLVRLGKIEYFIFTLLGMFNCLYTFSRTALLMYGLFYIALSFYYIQKRKHINKILLTIIITTILIILGGWVFNNLFHLTLDSSDGLFARFILWDLWYQRMLDKDVLQLILGDGIRSAHYYISTLTNLPVGNYHNVFLNILAELGILGFLLYILILFKIFYSNRLKNNSHLLILLLPLLSCLFSHYLGYDYDVVVYLSLVYLIKKMLENDPSAQHINTKSLK